MERKRVNNRSKMEEAKLEKVDLSGLSLESLPKPSLNLAMVSELDISNNNLQSIPESLTARLLNLVALDVHSNQLKSLPSSIGCLSKLKLLNISSNMIESLPTTIENCRSLEELNANFNQLTKLPETIGFELTNLRNLSIHSNRLVYLPFSTSHMTNLRILDAHLNCLRSLPEDLENLANLEILNVSQNYQYLDTLPDSIGLLPSLIELDVSYNKITILPNSIGWLKKLQKLHMHGNPLVSPPMEIVDESLEVVKAYMRERMNGDIKTPKKKRASWMGKLALCATFNSRMPSGVKDDNVDQSTMPDYRTIDGLTSPRYMAVFSPRRLFSPKRMGMFSPQRLFSPQKHFSK